MSFLSSDPRDMLSPGNVSLFMFLLGNLLIYMFVPANAAADARKHATHRILLVSIAISIVLVEMGVFLVSKQGPSGQTASQVPGVTDFVIAALNGILAVAAGAIVSVLTSAASEKARSSMGFGPRTAGPIGEKPLISSWL